MRIRHFALSVALAGILGACGIFTDEEVCTAVGCYSGLYIETDDRPPAPVHLRVRSLDGTVLEQECLPDLCVLGTLFEGVDAQSVEIQVTMNGHTETFTAELEYELIYPNGEDCGEPCRVTAVHLKMVGDRLVAA
jgi:hypothetical protein